MKKERKYLQMPRKYKSDTEYKVIVICKKDRRKKQVMK